MLKSRSRSPCRLLSRCLRRGNLGSILLAFSVLFALSWLLHAAHLLHVTRFVMHLQHPAQPDMDEFNLDRGIERAESERILSGQRCVHPVLNPDDPSIMQYYSKESPVDCSANMEDWVYVTNGTFRISRHARRLYGKITCEYAPLVRRDDFSARHAPHVKPMLDGTPLQADFFKVACVSASGKKYMNIHSGVAWNPAVHERLRRYYEGLAEGTLGMTPSERTGPSQAAEPLGEGDGDGVSHPSSPSAPQGLNLSVFMFGFDSLSRMAWTRLLPKTRRYFLGELGGVEMGGYNIVGDGTPAALLPILTGKLEEELPEARRGFQGATPVDNHPWVWRDFARRGYVTAHAEDMPHVGTFQLRMLGFKEQPTDHHMRTFYLAADRMYSHNPPLCLGSTPRHVNFMHWFRDLFDMYRPYPKFFFGFHSEMSHDYNNKVQALDDDLVAFLTDLEQRGHLNSTLLVLMADHGARYDYIRATAQGKLEERMPYFSFRFPPWFREKHPDIVRNMEINSKRLTTPFDVHETFMEVLNYTGSGMADLSKRGVSLFKEIPKERTCSQAHVTPHWCACLEWQRVNQTEPLVLQAVQTAIDTINGYTLTQRTQCTALSLLEVTRSARYVPNSHDRSREEVVLKYKHSNRPDSPGETPAPPPTVELYQVSFKTSPGQGHFEVTCSRDLASGIFSVAGSDISRINKYGSQASCIQESFPHLRPYCYCKA
ncbi:uncharacterized protein [Littorina saxatilis]|uniref:Uncharacterized protein n=1 Tax=Littorina saxatilis TaxID=31220 RepID=A0AAN9API3_9CAEN